MDEGSGPITLEMSKGEYPGELEVRWNTIPGNRYILEKTGELGEWFEVTSLVAESDSLSVTDTQLFGDLTTFWRVNALGPNGEPLEISDILVTYALSGAQSDMILEVIASGTETVQNVLFYDGTLLLGNAVQGPENVWGFSLAMDDLNPLPRQLTATATTTEGTQETTALYSFLLADPAKFVPLGISGKPMYGEFVSVDITGQLGPFQFVPEGGSASTSTSGVRFLFPSGALLVGTGPSMQISFTEASFVRGEGDPNPVEYSGTVKLLPINGLAPSAVATAFNLPLQDPIPIRWGRTWVDWYSGILGEGGWRELNVTPRIGDFVLPDNQAPTKVTFDSESGEELLLMSFHGEWSPVPGSVLFRIPTAEPLNIYQSKTGSISVQGAVEAELPNGITVKGGVTWRDPNFELRLEGKGITISALNVIREVLPEDPESQIPSGVTEEELDAFATTLSGYRNTLRSMSVGGLTHAEPADGDTYEPSPTPVDPVGTALEAWAWRAATWNSDRQGQYLRILQTAELVGIIEQAGQTGAAANDLGTALKLTHDLLLLKKHAPQMLGPDMHVIDSAMIEAEGQLYATVDRIIADTPSFATSDEFAECSALIKKVQALMEEPPPAPLSSKPQTIRKLDYTPYDSNTGSIPFETAIYDLYPRESLPGRIWRQGSLYPADEAALLAMDKDTLLGFLHKVSEIYVHISQGGSGIPAFPFVEVVLTIEDRLFELHNQQVGEAVSASGFEDIRTALSDRVSILDAYQILNMSPVAGLAAFSMETVDILGVYEPLWVNWLKAIDPSLRAERFFETAEILFRIAHHSDDPGLNSYLKAAWGDLRTFNDQMIESNQINGGCDALYIALSKRGYRMPHFDDDHDSNHTFSMTGRYEAADYTTLSINQAGRYLKGWWAVHSRGGKMSHYILKGLLMEEGPSSMTFAYLRIDPQSGEIKGQGTLRGFLNGQNVEITKTEYGSVKYLQLGNRATLSDSVISLFDPEIQEVLKSDQTAPMLPLNTVFVLDRAIRTKPLIDEYFAGNQITKQSVAVRINTFIQEILQQVPEEHRSLAHLLYFQELSKSRYTSGTNYRTYREGFMTVFYEQTGFMSDVPVFLGTEDTLLPTGPLYHYEITIEQEGVSAVNIGALRLRISVAKTNPDASQELFKYKGWLFQVGAGPGGGFGKSTNTIVYSSPINYSSSDLEGTILTGQAGWTAAYGPIGGSYSVEGFLKICGVDDKPPITLTEIYDEDPASGIQLSIGLDLAYGRMIAVSDFNDDPEISITNELLNYVTDEAAEFGTVLHFEFDSAVVSSCGRNALREFIAEYLTIFQNPTARIQIFGYTDTVGTDLYNIELSQNRADNAKATILSILGNPVGLDARIETFGLGEDPMLIATGQDELRDINWRKVEILVNGVVQVKLSAAGVKLADSGGSTP